jgi:hypothetical protein
VVASHREIEAAAAPSAAPKLAAQAKAYEGDRKAFRAPPSSEHGRAAAKAAAAQNLANDARSVGF